MCVCVCEREREREGDGGGGGGMTRKASKMGVRVQRAGERLLTPMKGINF